MAKRGKRDAGVALGITLIIGLAIVLIGGSAATVTFLRGNESARQLAVEELEHSHQVLTVLRQQRFQLLRYISRIFSTDELLTSYLAEAAQQGDMVSVLDSIEEYQNLLTFDLAVVLDRNGRVLTRTDDPSAAGEDLSASSLLTAALEDRENRAFGVWQQGEQLYYAAAVPLVRQFDLVGYIIVAFSIGDPLALQIERMGGAETLVLASSPTGPTVAASTLDPGQADRVVSGLRRSGEVLALAMNRGQRVDQEELELDGDRWLTFLVPLEDAVGQSIGATVILTPLSARVSVFRQILLVLAGTGAISLVVAVLLASALGRRLTKPLQTLAAATEQAAVGNLDTVVPDVGGGAAGRMAQSLSQMLSSMREKINLELYLGHVMRYLPEPAKTGGVARPAAGQVSLLAVEMRRFANPKIGYDPEENLGRFGRDIQRIATATASHQGRIESVYGHRVLAVFNGENHLFRALAAATEVLAMLSQRENVFDEPEPPAVALAAGGVITGSVIWGDHPSPAIAGVPVQQIESLLREATPGEIYFTKPIYDAMAPALQRAGIQARAQRGLLSPQPLLLINVEQAAQVTGVSPTADSSSYSEERRSLSDVAPGTVLGNRFDVLAQLGAGRGGLVIKARDRELGDLVTLKMLRGEVVADAARFERLRNVIRLARGIHHANILQVLDFGETDGIPFISFEQVRAMTLRYLIDQTERIPMMAALRIGRQITFGLLGAHQQGLLHLALKPQNVLVQPAGGVKLMDFGFSHLATADQESTVCYLAPEQLEGRDGEARSDLWAWGILMYEMLTGEPPRRANTVAEMRQKLMMEEVEPPSTKAELPSELEQIILRCLAQRPDDRFGTPLELLEALEELRF